ncbi:MAG: hypothetical protein COB26_10440 [Piscirickettsiaceae bacterium]|nr:MAG: hypothetical protein COB26_10440 [Piscirickettsiaceae bacterium]
MFGIEKSAQRSTVANRIFILFIFSSILPIAILAGFSIQQLNNQATVGVENELRQAAKNYGLLLNERLGMLDEHLLIKLRQLEPVEVRMSKQSKVDGFSNFYSMNLNDLSASNQYIFSLLSTTDKKSLTAGKPVLVANDQQAGESALYLMRAFEDSEKILVGEINSIQLWGYSEAFDLTKRLCLYGAKNITLFCSTNEHQLQLDSIKTIWQNASTGVTQLTSKENGLFVAYWSLFTQASFNYPRIMVTVSIDRETVAAPAATLKMIFAIVSVLVLVIITLLSTFKIRRYFVPLEELMKGIGRISKNNFTTPVVVNTDDEFKQLANSFNSMSSKVSNQIEFLSGITAIDQHILSNRSIKDILPAVMSQIKSAIGFEQASLLLIQQPNDGSAKLHNYSNSSSYVEEVNIDEEFIDTLKNKTVTYSIGDIAWPSFLDSLKSEGASIYFLVPVMLDNLVQAILIFSFKERNFTNDKQGQLRELSDRFAIAFEKSAWDKKLYKQAHFDPLTGLPNRQLLNDRLEQAIIQASRDQLYFALIFLDLDRFKVVNDTLGHHSGDELLILVAKRLKDTLREGDTIARQGGDEFIILLSGDSSRDEIISRAGRVANKILASIVEPFQLKGQVIHMSASLGVALYPSDGGDEQTLIKHADAAMYHAKSKGSGRFHLFSNELNNQSMERLKLEDELHKALARQEFELYYQPKVEAKTGRILGAEALIRWNHPQDGLVAPYKFLPLAEEIGLIKEIGEWTIQEACQRISAWQQDGFDNIVVSVNLSVQQFQEEGLVGVVSAALEAENVAAKFLDLEILEGTAMDDMDKTVDTLKMLKDIGVKISIDDYGTGYSTLSYIKKFPIDNLKIDMSFIRNIVNDEGDQAIVESTILMAKKLGLNVVAEGVEDEHQLTMLQEMGCDEIQGYYFSPPVPAEEFAMLLKNGFERKVKR